MENETHSSSTTTSWQKAMRLFRRCEHQEQLMVAPKRPVRVEPKSYFANERTFIQWMSSALLLITVSLILIEFQNGVPSSMYAVHIVGAALCASSTLVVFHGILSYHRRVKFLKEGKSDGYVNHIAPTFLAVAILIGLTALLVIFIKEGVNPANVRRIMVSNIQYIEGICEDHRVEGTPRLEYQPSDLVVDLDRQIILVPSGSNIRMYALNKDANAFPTSADFDFSQGSRIVATLPGGDIEGLTLARGRVYAVSEDGGGKSDLYCLSWTNNSLFMVQQWKLPTTRSEGIAYVPAPPPNVDGPGKFYVSGGSGDLSIGDPAYIDVYDEPPLTGSLVEALIPRRLNGNLMNDGLVDSKIGAMQYFEGTLYGLHDNERVVRAWDIEEGTMLSEWVLPRVGGNFDKQWEGMFLERRVVSSSGGGDRRLRGSASKQAGDEDARQLQEPSSSLILHLALDSPPEVWSLTVEEGDTVGSIILPRCASSS